MSVWKHHLGGILLFHSAAWPFSTGRGQRMSPTLLYPAQGALTGSAQGLLAWTRSKSRKFGKNASLGCFPPSTKSNAPKRATCDQINQLLNIIYQFDAETKSPRQTVIYYNNWFILCAECEPMIFTFFLFTVTTNINSNWLMAEGNKS